MKKYFFAILFFLGCLFVNFNIDNSVTNASAIFSVTTDAYNSRKITISLEGLNPRTNYIKINEVEYCQEGEESCNSYFISTNTYLRKIADTYGEKSLLETVTSTTLDYEITTSDDGMKYYLIETYGNDGATFLEYILIEYKLSTLSERVVLNPNAQGKPTHFYDFVQYSSVRKTNIAISLLDDEKIYNYSGIVYVCEEIDEKNTNCGEYDLNLDVVDYYIKSYGDGVKVLNVHLVHMGQSIVDLTKLDAELDTKATLISKKIHLDTIGPEITIEGGKWIFLESGERYEVQGATCKDAIFPDYECSVTNDANIIGIDYTSDNYQIVTYEATDRLGNTTSEAVKIKVDTTQKDNSIGLYLGISAGVLAITFTILGYILIKNHEKKKKMSYI